jgi:pyruvate/2-oxoglutarate dehydrogenase complex dihydrolipoamide acyltransferase (E2) component
VSICPAGWLWQWYLAHGAGAARSHDGSRSVSLVDLTQSFYVGDAAGRPGDHSDVDQGFAASVGLRFLTPEECFGNKSGSAGSSSSSSHLMPSSNEGHGGMGSAGPQAPPFPAAAVRAATALAAGSAAAAALPLRGSGSPRRPILLVLCGLAGSGKSTWAAELAAPRATTQARHAAAEAAADNDAGVGTGPTAACGAAVEWTVVCQDALKSRGKCEEACAAALAAGKSVVVDRTNLTPEQRAHFVQLVHTAVPRQASRGKAALRARSPARLSSCARSVSIFIFVFSGSGTAA